jgi:ATP-dependent Lon protease
VRELERVIGRWRARWPARGAEGRPSAGHHRARDLHEICSGPRSSGGAFREALTLPAWSAGLAWTETGGDVLYVEAMRCPQQDLTLTGTWAT